MSPLPLPLPLAVLSDFLVWSQLSPEPEPDWDCELSCDCLLVLEPVGACVCGGLVMGVTYRVMLLWGNGAMGV